MKINSHFVIIWGATTVIRISDVFKIIFSDGLFSQLSNGNDFENQPRNKLLVMFYVSQGRPKKDKAINSIYER